MSQPQTLKPLMCLCFVVCKARSPPLLQQPRLQRGHSPLPADVHGGHALPGVGFGVVALHGVKATGAIIATSHVEHPLEHGHARAAPAAQHVGNGGPGVDLGTGNPSAAPQGASHTSLPDQLWGVSPALTTQLLA